LNNVPNENKGEVKEEIAEFLLDTVLDYVSRGQSPVDGDAFDGLSKNYLPVKKKKTGSTVPNLELSGGMLDDLKTKIIGNTLEIGLFKDSASELSLLKADNHNKFTGKSRNTGVPKRAFIPKDGDYDEEIMDSIREIIADASENEVEKPKPKEQKSRAPNIRKQSFDESAKDTPEYDILLQQRKTRDIERKLSIAREKLKDLNDKENTVEELKAKKEQQRLVIEDAKRSVEESKNRIKILKERLKGLKK